MTSEQFDRIIRKIDDAIGPPDSESLEHRDRRLAAFAARRWVRPPATMIKPVLSS